MGKNKTNISISHPLLSVPRFRLCLLVSKNDDQLSKLSSSAFFLPNRSCSETTVRMSNTVNTVAATTTQSDQGTSRTSACTPTRVTTTTLMQSSTVAQSTAIKMRMKTRRKGATGQMEEAQQAAVSPEQGALTLTGAVSVQTEGTAALWSCLEFSRHFHSALIHYCT